MRLKFCDYVMPSIVMTLYIEHRSCVTSSIIMIMWLCIQLREFEQDHMYNNALYAYMISVHEETSIILTFYKNNSVCMNVGTCLLMQPFMYMYIFDFLIRFFLYFP